MFQSATDWLSTDQECREKYRIEIIVGKFQTLEEAYFFSNNSCVYHELGSNFLIIFLEINPKIAYQAFKKNVNLYRLKPEASEPSIIDYEKDYDMLRSNEYEIADLPCSEFEGLSYSILDSGGKEINFLECLLPEMKVLNDEKIESDYQKLEPDLREKIEQQGLLEEVKSLILG